MTTYVVRPDGLYDKATGKKAELSSAYDGRPLAAPQIARDYAGYQSPIDGRWVDGRADHREDLKRNGCVLKESLPRPARNPNRIAAQHQR